MDNFEKKCTKCGKVFTGVTEVCPDCTNKAFQSVTAPSAQLSTGGKSMFASSMNEFIPNTIEDCTAQDALTKTLWNWAINLEKYGAVLLVLILIGGLIYALANAMVVTNAAGTTDFSIPLFIAAFFSTIIYAVLEYLIYHALALLVASLAKIVHSTRTTARLAEWNARNQK